MQTSKDKLLIEGDPIPMSPIKLINKTFNDHAITLIFHVCEEDSMYKML